MSLYLHDPLCIYYLLLINTVKTWGCGLLLSGCWVRLIVWYVSSLHKQARRWMAAQCIFIIIVFQEDKNSVQGTCFDVPLPFHTHQLNHLLYCFVLRAYMHACILMHPSLLQIFVGCRQRNKRMCVVRLFTWYKGLGWAEEAVCPACNFSPHVESDHQSIYTHPSSTQQWGNFQWSWGKQWHERNQQQLHLNIS